VYLGCLHSLVVKRVHIERRFFFAFLFLPPKAVHPETAAIPPHPAAHATPFDIQDALAGKSALCLFNFSILFLRDNFLFIFLFLCLRLIVLDESCVIDLDLDLDLELDLRDKDDGATFVFLLFDLLTGIFIYTIRIILFHFF